MRFERGCGLGCFLRLRRENGCMLVCLLILSYLVAAKIPIARILCGPLCTGLLSSILRGSARPELGGT